MLKYSVPLLVSLLILAISLALATPDREHEEETKAKPHGLGGLLNPDKIKQKSTQVLSTIKNKISSHSKGDGHQKGDGQHKSESHHKGEKKADKENIFSRLASKAKQHRQNRPKKTESIYTNQNEFQQELEIRDRSEGEIAGTRHEEHEEHDHHDHHDNREHGNRLEERRGLEDGESNQKSESRDSEPKPRSKIYTARSEYEYGSHSDEDGRKIKSQEYHTKHHHVNEDHGYDDEEERELEENNPHHKHHHHVNEDDDYEDEEEKELEENNPHHKQRHHDHERSNQQAHEEDQEDDFVDDYEDDDEHERNQRKSY